MAEIPTDPQHLIGLQVERFKRIRLVHLDLEGKRVIYVGGRNRQGKSSLFDGVQAAFAGKKNRPQEPVHRGEDDAKILVQTEDLTVSLAIDADGKEVIVVRDHSGAKITSPQTVLDKMYSQLTFDPMAFDGMEPKKQVELLRQLAGVDTSKLDLQHEVAFDKRAEVNRDIAKVKGQLAGSKLYKDVPDEAPDLQALIQEYQALERQNLERQQMAQGHENTKAKIAANKERKKKLLEEIEQLDAKNAELLDIGRKELAWLDANPVQDTTEALRKMEEVQELTAKVNHNKTHYVIKLELDRLQEASADLSNQLEAIKKEKTRLIAEAKLPVEGLTWDDAGVRIDGTLWADASQRERIVASASIGVALHPQLRFCFVRDASLIDEEGRRLIYEVAHEHDVQFFMEVVGDNVEAGDIGIILEDGEVQKQVG